MAEMKPKSNDKDPAKDLCMTPSYAVKPLIDLLGLNSTTKGIWEPASGEGDLVSTMRNLGLSVGESSLEHGEDFFDHVVSSKYYHEDCGGIITNPPYSIKPEWIKRCYEITKNWALLLPLEAIAAAVNQEQFKANGGVSILLFDSRIDFKMPEPGKSGNADKWGFSSAQFPTCWVISGFGLEPDKIYHASIKEEKAIFKKMHKMLNT